jgi:hypothetical protein
MRVFEYIVSTFNHDERDRVIGVVRNADVRGFKFFFIEKFFRRAAEFYKRPAVVMVAQNEIVEPHPGRAGNSESLYKRFFHGEISREMLGRICFRRAVFYFTAHKNFLREAFGSLKAFFDARYFDDVGTYTVYQLQHLTAVIMLKMIPDNGRKVNQFFAAYPAGKILTIGAPGILIQINA